jgi:kumamolisin
MTAQDASEPTAGAWDERVEVPGSEREAVARARRSGEEVDRNQPITVTLLLAPDPASRRRLESLHSLAQEDVAPGRRGPYAERADLVAANRPSDDALLRVGMFAAKYGLAPVGPIHPPGLLTLEGRWQDMERAFETKLEAEIQLDRHGREILFRQRTGPLTVPRPVAGDIEGVFSSDDRRQARMKMHTQTHENVQPAQAILASGEPLTFGMAQGGQRSFTPRNLAKLYEFPEGLDGRGQTIGIIALGGAVNLTAVATFFAHLQSPHPTITQVVAEGVPDPLGKDPEADDEMQLDIQMAASIAPGAPIVVYVAPNNSSGYLRALAAAVYDQVHTPTVCTSSYGLAENRWTGQARKAIDRVLQDAASLGVTVCIASGDSGSSDDEDEPGTARVDYPSASPYALACGGTQFDLAEAGIQLEAGASVGRLPETVWNDGHGAASGGGVSDSVPLPDWQQARGIVVTRTGGKGSPAQRRALPDVAGNADPRTGCVLRFPDPSDPKRRQDVAGGTSLVAPMYAGLIARINQAIGQAVGYVNPYLYKSIDTSRAFEDIKHGDNGAYQAHDGWDACTGFGRIRGRELLDQLR